MEKGFQKEQNTVIKGQYTWQQVSMGTKQDIRIDN